MDITSTVQETMLNYHRPLWQKQTNKQNVCVTKRCSLCIGVEIHTSVIQGPSGAHGVSESTHTAGKKFTLAATAVIPATFLYSALA